MLGPPPVGRLQEHNLGQDTESALLRQALTLVQGTESALLRQAARKSFHHGR